MVVKKTFCRPPNACRWSIIRVPKVFSRNGTAGKLSGVPGQPKTSGENRGGGTSRTLPPIQYSEQLSSPEGRVHYEVGKISFSFTVFPPLQTGVHYMWEGRGQYLMAYIVWGSCLIFGGGFVVGGVPPIPFISHSLLAFHSIPPTI